MKFKFHGGYGKALPCTPRNRQRSSVESSLPAKQLLRVMKLVTFIIFACCLQVSANSNAQITISLKNVPLIDVLKEIEKQTDIRFVFVHSDIAQNASVSIVAKNENIENVFHQVFDPLSISWSIVDKFVILKRNINDIELSNQSSNMRDTTVQRTISGKIYNERGQTLAGATIIVKRTGKGANSDATGSFRLQDLIESDELHISFTGFTAQDIKTKGKNTIIVYLEPSMTELDKVIIQGYGETTKRIATGNIQTVSSQVIGSQVTMNALEAIQGRVAGLTVTSTSGYATAPYKMELRGRSVISDNLPSEPLIIVDGVPITILNLGSNNYQSGSAGFAQGRMMGPANGHSPLASINPEDIESISVLKDADATAIYGSRGGQGVILVTTKKGRAGQTKFDANVYTGQSFVTTYYNLMNTQQYVAMRKEAFANNNIQPDISNAYDLLVWDTTRYTDWQKFFWGKPASNTDVELSLSGGEKNTTFRVSAGYHKLSNLNSLSGFDDRGSVQVNLQHRTNNQKLNIAFIGFYSFLSLANISLGGAVNLPPNAPAVFDDQGKLNYAGWVPISNDFPFGIVLNPFKSKTSFLNANLKVDYEIVKGLKVSSTFGYSTNKMNQHSVVTIASQNPENRTTGTATFGTNDGSRRIIEPMIEYQCLIGKGELKAIIGGTYQDAVQTTMTVQGSGYIRDELLGSISNAPVKNASDGSGEYKYVAAFARINFNLDRKYLITLSGRRDGSSKFGPGRRFGNFGAIGAAWIFSEEKFIKNQITFLSFGKIRASHGIIGSDLISDYRFLTRWVAGNLYYSGASYVPSGLANPYLQWQADKKTEVAINFGFWNDRILFDLAYYRNRSSNQLLQLNLPRATGFMSVTGNFPATVQNVGWEPQLNIKIIDKKNTELSFNANTAFNQNRLIAFPDIEKSPYASQYVVGKPLSIRLVLEANAIDPATGLWTYKDNNNDGQVTYGGTNDDRVWKNYTIRADGGFGFDARLNNWKISVFFHGRIQEAKNAFYGAGWPGQIFNQPVDALDRWQKTGDVAKFPRYIINSDVSDNYFTQSDASYSDASFLRFKNVVISYDIPKSFQKKVPLKNGKVYLRAQNLMLFTNYKGGDPEIIGFGVLPPLTSIVGGFQFGF
jgi:TonB-linked SusC/RagA family outer membrane protein